MRNNTLLVIPHYAFQHSQLTIELESLTGPCSSTVRAEASNASGSGQ